MRATVQIDKYNWQDEPALYVFYIDFDIKPQKDDTIDIEYNGRFIRATVYDITHRLKINSDNCKNKKPEVLIRAELIQEYDID